MKGDFDLDLGSIIGFISGAAFVVMSLFMSASFDAAKVAKIFDGPSVMITFGGTVACVLIAYPLQRTLAALKGITIIFKESKIDLSDAIDKTITLANLARREGILALEETASNMDDPFLQKGIMLIVDGTDPELVKSILETEMAYIESRHNDTRGVWDFIGSMGPAWGMIGTLIGLIMMLQDMSDPDSLGPNMAIALITTFYGSMLANYVATPVSNKMKVFNNDEMLLKEILIEGVLSIQAGENPRIIEEKLKSFISPSLRGKSGESESSAKAGDD